MEGIDTTFDDPICKQFDDDVSVCGAVPHPEVLTRTASSASSEVPCLSVAGGGVGGFLNAPLASATSASSSSASSSSPSSSTTTTTTMAAPRIRARSSSVRDDVARLRLEDRMEFEAFEEVAVRDEEVVNPSAANTSSSTSTATASKHSTSASNSTSTSTSSSSVSASSSSNVELVVPVVALASSNTDATAGAAEDDEEVEEEEENDAINNNNNNNDSEMEDGFSRQNSTVSGNFQNFAQSEHAMQAVVVAAADSDDIAVVDPVLRDINTDVLEQLTDEDLQALYDPSNTNNTSSNNNNNNFVDFSSTSASSFNNKNCQRQQQQHKQVRLFSFFSLSLPATVVDCECDECTGKTAAVVSPAATTTTTTKRVVPLTPAPALPSQLPARARVAALGTTTTATAVMQSPYKPRTAPRTDDRSTSFSSMNNSSSTATSTNYRSSGVLTPAPATPRRPVSPPALSLLSPSSASRRNVCAHVRKDGRCVGYHPRVPQMECVVNHDVDAAMRIALPIAEQHVKSKTDLDECLFFFALDEIEAHARSCSGSMAAADWTHIHAMVEDRIRKRVERHNRSNGPRPAAVTASAASASAPFSPAPSSASTVAALSSGSVSKSKGRGVTKRATGRGGRRTKRRALFSRIMMGSDDDDDDEEVEIEEALVENDESDMYDGTMEQDE